MNKKFTKLLAAFALLVFMTPSLVGWGQTRATGDEIDRIANIVSGKAYYIKGQRTSGNSTITEYLSFTDEAGSQSGTSVSNTSDAVAIIFTNVSDGVYTLKTLNGNYIAPGTSNGKISVATSATNVSVSNQTNSLNSNNCIRLSITTGSNTWAIQKNKTAGNFGGYKVTQWDITLIEAGSIATITSLSYTGTPTTTTYEVGDSFDPTGLTVTATYSDESTEDVTADVVWTPDPLTQGTTSVTGTYSGLTVTVPGITVTAPAGPDIVLNYNNSPFTATSANSNIATVTLDGIEYRSYGGYNYTNSSGSYLSISRDVEGYLGNNTQLYGNIKKIVVDYATGGASLFTMYEGAAALLETTTVSPSGNGTGAITYTFSGNNGYFKFKRTTTGTNYSDYSNINSISIYLKDSNNPAITVSPSSLSFTYVYGTDENDLPIDNITVNGSNLTANISLTLNANSDFEMSTDLDTWSSTLTLTQTNGSVTNEEVAIRLKAGLAKGNYSGTVTLSSTDAQNVVVDLSGSVTGQMFNIVLTQPATGGTIASDLEVAEEGVIVTLTATPDAAFNFGSWIVEDEDENPINVNNNQFEMPASNVLVSATFTAKPTYTITTVVTPTDGGAVVTLDNAYEGQNVEVEVETATGFTFSSLVVSKTGDASTTVETSGSLADGFSFTMPDYAVTITATFISDTYSGSFVLFTGDALEEGDYVLVYNGKAMNNDGTTTSNKLGATSVNTSTDIITNPSRTIVWHIAPSVTEGYWTIYNAKVNKYVNATASSTNLNLIDNPTYASGAKWNVTEGESTYDFRCKANEDLSSGSTVRYIRHYNSVFGHYATSNGGPLTLYKYTVLTERTITFNGNGGETSDEETTYTQTVYDGIAANLTANQFTYGSSIFTGWSSTQNGLVEYADGASITVNSDITLYAQWTPGYTVMVDDEIEGGSVYIVTTTGNEEIIEAAEGAEITLTYTANAGYSFSEWVVYYTDEEDQIVPVEVTDNKFIMPAYDVTVSATFVEATTYSLVTNVNQIVSGKHYIIASDYYGDVKVMASQAENNRTTVDAYALWEEVIQETEGIYEFVINGPNTDNYYTIYDVVNGGYLYAAGSGSGKNYLRNQATNDGNGLWSFSIDDETGAAEVVAQGSNTNKYMRFNNTLFSCYAETSSIQNPVYLFVKDNDNDYEYYGCEVTYAETSIEGSITVGEGSVMTITNSEFSNDDPAKLIIENGGQLVTSNDVAATLKKLVKSYDNDEGEGGWKFIASPLIQAVPATNIINMIDATPANYGLFYYDEPDHMWRNYKEGTSEHPSTDAGFNIMPGKGYLYAKNSDVTIEFVGEMRGAEDTYTISNLSHESTGSKSNGFNLVGNPFTYTVYANQPFYIPSDDMLATIDQYWSEGIAPGSGIMVQATEDNNHSVTFTRTAPEALSKGSLQMNLAQNISNRGGASSAKLDKAIISFNEGSQLGKFYLGESAANIYIPQGNEEYAIVSTEAQGEMPVNFRASENGTYTLSIDIENVEMNYLHLIDNMTGNDIDLLQTPSYTFEATTRDYESRFRLVFAANNNNEDGPSTGSGTFAFYSNGNWIINNAGEATLQVIDLTGRILSSETVNGSVSKTINATPGVYMLRLINGEKVNVQKIVVR